MNDKLLPTVAFLLTLFLVLNITKTAGVLNGVLFAMEDLVLHTTLGLSHQSDFNSMCLELNGTLGEKTCEHGDKNATRYTTALACETWDGLYTIVIHHNEGVDIEGSNKVDKRCTIVKEDRGLDSGRV